MGNFWTASVPKSVVQGRILLLKPANMLPTPLACSRFIGTISAGGTDIPANAKHAELVNTRYAAPSAQNQSVCFESATLHL